MLLLLRGLCGFRRWRCQERLIGVQHGHGKDDCEKNPAFHEDFLRRLRRPGRRRDRIDTMTPEGAATTQPAKSEPSTADDPVREHRVAHVVGA